MIPFTTIDSICAALRMRRVPRPSIVPRAAFFFFAVVCFFSVHDGGRVAAESTNAYKLRGCGVQLTIPTAYIVRQETPTVLLARARTGEELIVSCLPNVKRTSRHEDLAADLRREGDEIWSEERMTAGALPAVIYLRRGLEMGKPIERAEGYVAARSFEVRVSLLYPSASPKAMERLADVRRIFESITFTVPTEGTITESSYRLRLTMALSLLAAAGLAVTFVLVNRRRRRRDQRRAAEKPNPEPENPQ